MRAGEPIATHRRMRPEHAGVRTELLGYLKELQADICAALERADGSARFTQDAWDRPGGGGGLTCLLTDGQLLERAGVNFSDVHGELAPEFARHLPGEGRTFAAVGLSVVIHPRSPMIPTTHANFRFIIQGEKAWFGGGADLTPYYLFEEDVAHFHRTFKSACDRRDPSCYRRFKKACDDYFYLRHRGEHRGVGGIFFENMGGDPRHELAFVVDCARSFLPAYVPIAERRRGVAWGERERAWQEIRRGRYVEFNLMYDRGTVFGLETGGRVESILMSLPPRVRWVYDEKPEEGSPEARLLEAVRTPREWA